MSEAWNGASFTLDYSLMTRITVICFCTVCSLWHPLKMLRLTLCSIVCNFDKIIFLEKVKKSFRATFYLYDITYENDFCGKGYSHLWFMMDFGPNFRLSHINCYNIKKPDLKKTSPFISSNSVGFLPKIRKLDQSPSWTITCRYHIPFKQQKNVALKWRKVAQKKCYKILLIFRTIVYSEIVHFIHQKISGQLMVNDDIENY